MRLSVYQSNMPTGASTLKSGSYSIVPRVLSFFVLIHLCLAAPGLPGAQRVESDDAPPPSTTLANPFGTGEEDRRLLKSYLQAHLKDGQGGPELHTRDQEVFFLFRLYDFDRSGHLDGLELMKLLSDFNSNIAPGAKANERVVSLVDFLLQTQDLNQDGLLAPSELLSPPLQHSKDSDTHNPLNQEQEVAPEEKAGEGEIKEEEEKQPEGEQDEMELKDQGREEPAAEKEQQGQHVVPVHLGQPEM